jgi:hypothetical protein
MDNVQNCDSYINIPLSQTYRSYIAYKVFNYQMCFVEIVSLFMNI